MQPSQGSRRGAKRVVDLAEMFDEIMLLELVLAERSCEKAALVAFSIEVDQICARKWGGSKDHWRKNAHTLRAGKIGDLCHILEEIKAAFQDPQPDKLVTIPVFLAKPVIDQFTVELFHAGRKIILQLEIGKQRI